MVSDGLSALLTGDEARPWSVSELNSLARLSIEREFGSVWVEGEVVSFVAHSSGHWYFNLKDGDASIKCVVWRSTNQRIRYRPENGNVIRVKGNLTIWETAGVYQLNVRSIEPAGEGAILAAIAQIRARLDAEGMFDPALKRPLPFFPRKVGIVTARGGAAIGDIRSVLRRRARSVNIVFAPAAVQGDGAAASIISGIRLLEKYNKTRPESERIDVAIVGRGGGSAEDLWAFNDEQLARVIRACPFPIISAVGHEIDNSIADDVADVRAGTPSIAAEMVAAREDDIVAFFDHSSRRMTELTQRMVSYESDNIESLFRSLLHIETERMRQAAASIDSAARMLRPGILTNLAQRMRQRLDSGESLATQAINRLIAGRAEDLNVAAAKLDALSPLAVLARGFSLTTTMDGQVVRSSNDVEAGDRLKVRIATGAIDVEVVDVPDT